MRDRTSNIKVQFSLTTALCAAAFSLAILSAFCVAS